MFTVQRMCAAIIHVSIPLLTGAGRILKVNGQRPRTARDSIVARR